jgi:hypothetical protein
MPSAGIASRASRASLISTRRRQVLLGGWTSFLLVLILAGCASGTADEARIAETREATKGAIVADVQATNVVKEFFPPTTTPEPTRTPMPTLATLTLANQLGSDNQPVNEVDSVRQGGTVYAVAEIHDLQAGQTVTAVWSTADGSEVSRSSVPVDRGLSGAWVPFQWSANVGPGSYAVYIYVNDRLLNSLVFRVN